MAFPLGNLPTDAQKVAMIGFPGPPSSGNPFVTSSDSRVGDLGFINAQTSTLGSNIVSTSTSYTALLTINYTPAKFSVWFLFANVFTDNGQLADIKLADELGDFAPLAYFGGGGPGPGIWTTDGSGSTVAIPMFFSGYYNGPGNTKTFTLYGRALNGGLGGGVTFLSGTNLNLVY